VRPELQRESALEKLLESASEKLLESALERAQK
jgi:hypothetical protein